MDKTQQPPQHQERQPGREDRMDPPPDYMPRFPGSGRLDGKVALITGGDSGIGRAVAVAMAREGASIGIVYLEEDQDAEETSRAVREEGSDIIQIAGDIGDEDFCREAVKRTIAEYGRLDVLVNNAAEQHEVSDFRDLSAEQLQRTFKTNVFGYFYMTKAALEHIGAGGSIVNTTSITAYQGYPDMVDYSATRGAIVSFTRSMAGALVERGIRVNAVAPGPIWTPLIPASFDAEKVARHGSSAPMGRAGQPNEVASCYVFLASEEGSYMTGQVLHPNGGNIVGS
ncbi:SDR family oxidoreductase [Pelagibius sp. 7325]|uniref:SDR family oxidoreductase n=1 Tax=Pelagibius sp. 7325 TaxID=3131994 RepID=UPI0030ED14C9